MRIAGVAVDVRASADGNSLINTYNDQIKRDANNDDHLKKGIRYTNITEQSIFVSYDVGYTIDSVAPCELGAKGNENERCVQQSRLDHNPINVRKARPIEESFS